ncbi:hypothetical protein AAFC00_005690 [Neodothiora populina]|uniref:Uncharacterized protein n=1 Tax=Neodothiora populina TaxID=2781224 RepID=A0ABR3P5P6_9PEZI
MATGPQILAAEIGRIIKSPYPTQLKSLHKIVDKITEADIRSWSQCNPCLTTTLARILLEALPQWSYVLDTITRLSCAISIRDAFLSIEPQLLGQVVNEALEVKSSNRKFLDLSVALLSHPLPDDTAIPSSAQNLLIHLFGQAASKPDLYALLAVHSLLRGACRPIIAVLPSKIMSSFEQLLLDIMRDLASVKDKTPAIYCLSIMEVIVHEIDLTSTHTTSVHPCDDMDSSSSVVGSHWKPESLGRLFKDAKAHRTLSLVSLQVIWSCTSGTEQSEPDAALASVIMANGILEAIPPSERDVWCKQNAQILRKLRERCLVPDLSYALRLQALTFVVLLDKASTPITQLQTAYAVLLCKVGRVSSTETVLRRALTRSLPSFLPTLGPQFWVQFVGSIVELLLTSDAELIATSASHTVCLLEQMMSLMETHSSCRQGLLLCLSTDKYRLGINDILKRPISCGFAKEKMYCAKALSKNSGDLTRTFTAMILRAALTVQADEVQLPLQLVPCIIERHAISSANPIECSRCTMKAHSAPRGTVFVEVQGTADSQDASLPWKEKITSRMAAHAKDQQKAIIDSFAEICRDLEERCEIVEAPLRVEQEKFLDLHSRHETLGKAYGELEAKLMDRDLRINALEAEADSQAGQVASCDKKCQDLAQQADELLQALDNTRQEAHRSLAAADRDRQVLEMEHATAMACKQGSLDETREELQRVQDQMHELNSKIDHLEEGDKRIGSKNEQLISRIHELEAQLAERQQKIATADSERATLLAANSSLNQDIEALRKDASIATRKLEELQEELDDVQAESKRSLAKASSSFDEAMARHRQDWMGVKDFLEKQIQEARLELTQAEEDLHQQAQVHKLKVMELREKVERLNNECHKKDAQVLEVQEMRNRLMSAMGLSGALPEAIMSMPEPSTKSSTLPYRSASAILDLRPSFQPVSSTPAPSPDESDVEAEEADFPYNSDVSSDHGPTPKRSRSHQLSVHSNKVQEIQSIGRRSVRSVLRTKSATKRQPLMDLDGNRSPTKDPRSPMKVTFKDIDNSVLGISTGERRDMEDWSFSAVDILTGTPGVGLGDQTDYLEESTADL